MDKKIDLRGITRSALIKIINDQADVNGVFEMDGIKMHLDAGKPYLECGKIKAFLLGYASTVKEWHVYEGYDLLDAQNVIDNLVQLCDTFGIKSVGMSPRDVLDGVPKATTEPQTDERDLEIAGLKAQIEVYKSMLPKPTTITMEM